MRRFLLFNPLRKSIPKREKKKKQIHLGNLMIHNASKPRERMGLEYKNVNEIPNLPAL